jgi:hypothetical protein
MAPASPALASYQNEFVANYLIALMARIDPFKVRSRAFTRPLQAVGGRFASRFYPFLLDPPAGESDNKHLIGANAPVSASRWNVM